MKYIKLITFFIIISVMTNNLFAGYYNITPSSISNSGLFWEPTGALSCYNGVAATSLCSVPVPWDSTQSGFFNNSTSPGSTAELKIIGLSIKSEQSWGSIAVNVTSKAGSTNNPNYSIYISDSTGITVYSRLNIASSTTVDLTKISQLGNSNTITVRIILSMDIALNSIKVNYSGLSIFCYPTPFKINGASLKVSYDIPANAKVTIKIIDNRGKLVKSLLNEVTVQALNTRYESNIKWDGKNKFGNLVATGIYRAYIKVRFLDRSSGYADYESVFKFLVIR